MIKKTFYFIGALFLILQSCDSDDDTTTVLTETVKLAANNTHGNILTDTDGKSLYFFSLDHQEAASCVDDCVTNWPIFYTEKLVLPEGLLATDFASIVRSDGKKQSTYKGWPLYYFVNDETAGDTNGDNIGNVWFIAKPDYVLMYVKAQLIGKGESDEDVNYKSDYSLGEELTPYLTDALGNTIYTFINDKKDKNNFTSEDFSNNGVWPIFHVELGSIPSVLDANDFNVIDVHGQSQLTYKGWPLYYFGADMVRGDNYGINFPAPGVWPIANTETIWAVEN